MKAVLVPLPSSRAVRDILREVSKAGAVGVVGAVVAGVVTGVVTTGGAAFPVQATNRKAVTRVIMMVLKLFVILDFSPFYF